MLRSEQSFSLLHMTVYITFAVTYVSHNITKSCFRYPISSTHLPRKSGDSDSSDDENFDNDDALDRFSDLICSGEYIFDTHKYMTML